MGLSSGFPNVVSRETVGLQPRTFLLPQCCCIAFNWGVLGFFAMACLYAKDDVARRARANHPKSQHPPQSAV
jgi:hypothetical protein